MTPVHGGAKAAGTSLSIDELYTHQEPDRNDARRL